MVVGKRGLRRYLLLSASWIQKGFDRSDCLTSMDVSRPYHVTMAIRLCHLMPIQKSGSFPPILLLLMLRLFAYPHVRKPPSRCLAVTPSDSLHAALCATLRAPSCRETAPFSDAWADRTRSGLQGCNISQACLVLRGNLCKTCAT